MVGDLTGDQSIKVSCANFAEGIGATGSRAAINLWLIIGMCANMDSNIRWYCCPSELGSSKLLMSLQRHPCWPPIRGNQAFFCLFLFQSMKSLSHDSGLCTTFSLLQHCATRRLRAEALYGIQAHQNVAQSTTQNPHFRPQNGLEQQQIISLAQNHQHLSREKWVIRLHLPTRGSSSSSPPSTHRTPGALRARCRLRLVGAVLRAAGTIASVAVLVTMHRNDHNKNQLGISTFVKFLDHSTEKLSVSLQIVQCLS